MAHKRLGLALGGGAVRGFAHVGVLRVLEREGIAVDCVAGTSAGSVVGVGCAAGFTGDQFLEATARFSWRHIARPVWPREGLVSFAPLEALMVELLGDLSFDELAIPYAAVAADLATGEQVILRQGRVAPAVRASCCVPGLVEPVEWNGRLLVDGGIANNLPISIVRDLGADVVIAVGLHPAPGHCPRGPLRSGIAAVEYLILHTGDHPSRADVHLPVPAGGLGNLLFMSRRHRLVALGQEVAEAALPAIRAALGDGRSTQEDLGRDDRQSNGGREETE